MEIEPVTEIRAVLGECPVWSTRDRCLFWIDIDGRLIHRFDPETGGHESRSVPGRPGSVALTNDPDGFLVAMEHSLIEFTWSTGAVQELAQLETDDSTTRLNDGRCDASGRFWVGSLNDPFGGDQGRGMLHRVETDGSATIVETGVGVSNSLAFSPDGSVMYWSDTTKDTVWAFDYDLQTGERRNRRVFLDFASLPGRPDGACVDESGCLWVACVYGWSVLRATPGGDVDHVIELPVEKPSMPAFGGADLTTLFVTSISAGGVVPASDGQPLAGALLALSPGARGIPEPVFGG